MQNNIKPLLIKLTGALWAGRGGQKIIHDSASD